MKRYIVLDANNKVVSERFDTSIADGEIESEFGELGQIMQPDGSFITPDPESVPVQATIEEQILVETIYQTALLEMQMLGGSN